MAWGDSWGSGPCTNARRLAKAFYEGRELGGNRVTRVQYNADMVLCYYERNACIADRTTDLTIAHWVTEALEGRQPPWHVQEILECGGKPAFCAGHADKAAARHLKALGVDAKWQYGGKPFLIFGRDTTVYTARLTIEAWQDASIPLWVEPPAKPRREPFINLTLPLFA